MPLQLPDLNSQPIASLVYLKTNLAGYFFDAFLRVGHSRRTNITQHPVQTGASVADHAFVEGREITFQIGMSDTAKSLIPGQFTGGWSRSIQAYKVLEELQTMRVPMQVHTRLGAFQNMVIEELKVDDDYTTLWGLRCTVVMREIIVAQVRTVKISAKPAVTNQSKGGKKEPINDASVAEQIRQKFSGG